MNIKLRSIGGNYSQVLKGPDGKVCFKLWHLRRRSRSTTAERPKYWGSWKGHVVEAIASHGTLTWDEIQKATGLNNEALNMALHELFDTGEIEETAGKYKVCYALFKDYTKFLKDQQAFQESPKQKEKSETPTSFPVGKNELVNWIDRWKTSRKLDFVLEHEHFFLVGRHLNDFSEELINNAKNEVLIVNPFIQDCNLSKTVEDTHNNGAKVTVVTQPPDEKDPYLKEKQEYHQRLKEEGINLIYNKQVHAKLIVVDNSIAIVSSMNFYSGSTGGRTWEAGLITTENKTVKSIVDSINKLQEKLGRKNTRP